MLVIPDMGVWVAQGAQWEADETKNRQLFSLCYCILDVKNIKLIDPSAGGLGYKALDILKDKY